MAGVGIGSGDRRCGRCWHRKWGQEVWQVLAQEVGTGGVAGVGIGSGDRRCGRCWHRKWGQEVWQVLA